MPEPPPELMQAPQNLQPLPTNVDGTLDAKTAISVIVSNNTQCLSDEAVLKKLQQWIVETKKNIDNGGK